MEYPMKARQDFRSPVPQQLPANDNRPSAPVIPFPTSTVGKRVVAKSAQSFAGLAVKGLLRLNPWVRLAWTIWDIYDAYRVLKRGEDVPFHFVDNRWVVDCGGGGGTPHARWKACIPNALESPSEFGAREGVTAWQYPPGTTWYVTFRGPAHQEPGFPPGYMRFPISGVYHWNAVSVPPVAPPADYVPAHTEPPRVVPNPAMPRPVAPGRPYVPQVGVPPMPVVPPQLDPMALPIGDPLQPYKPLPWRLLPYRQPNPYRSPTEQPSWGPAPTPRPTLLEPAGPTLVFDPGQPVKIGAPPSLGRHGKGRGVKETKVKINRALAISLHVAGKVTETVDAVEALYDALPDDVKPHVGKYVKKTVLPQVKAKLVYQHFDRIDIEEAIINLVKNEIEDRVIGYFGNKAKEAAKKSRPHGDLPIGFGVGPGV